MHPDQDSRGGELLRSRQSRQRVDLTVAEAGLEIGADHSHPVPVGFQSRQKRVASRVQPEAAEIEMGLGRR